MLQLKVAVYKEGLARTGKESVFFRKRAQTRNIPGASASGNRYNSTVMPKYGMIGNW